MTATEIVVRDYKTHPDPEYRLFLFGPEWDGLMFFKSEQARAEAAEEAINAYKDLDNGWSEEVECLLMGEVTHLCTQANVVERPPAEDLDEEGCDGEGSYWGPDIEKRCDYEMLPLPAGGRPMDTAPQDGTPILVYAQHDSDPYHDGRDRLTPYGAHAEAMGHAPDGFHIVVWGGAYEEEDFRVPDWWFVEGSEFETPAAPVCWWPLPMIAEGK